MAPGPSSPTRQPEPENAEAAAEGRRARAADDDASLRSRSSGRRCRQGAGPAVDDAHRFMVELEFVQCLANPYYLHWLAQQQYFQDARFLSYLKYLEYWRKPEYAQFIIYPHCLRMLGLLQHTSFREELGKHDTAAAIYQRQILHWRHWRYPRPAFSGAAAGAGAEAAPADVKAPSPGEEHVARNAVRGASLGARRKS